MAFDEDGKNCPWFDAEQLELRQTCECSWLLFDVKLIFFRGKE